jgi:hypothetical protein
LRTGTTVCSPGRTIEVSIIAGAGLVSGVAQPLYRRPSDGAVFTAGTAGTVYQLQVKNLNPRGRVEVLAAVDGRNTLKDEPGDTHHNRGLVFGAGSTEYFTGWRLSDTETRQFVFAAPGRSVAAQATGSAAGAGVIGFAAFAEADAPPLMYYSLNATTPGPFMGNIGAASGGTLTRGVSYTASAGAAQDVFFSPSAVADAASQLGTGIGERQTDRVRSTSFIRAGGPDIIVIWYDTLAMLDAMGITGGEPAAFPGIDATGYERYAAA